MKDIQEKIFEVGMLWRMVYGAIRIFIGLGLLKIVGESVLDIFTKLMWKELVEDPQDSLYIFIYNIFTLHPVHITYFLATYFIFWGVVDLFLSYNLIKHNLWAFPLSFVSISFFTLYEIWRFAHTHSIILFGIIIIDIFVLWLIFSEYKKLKIHLN